MTTSEHAPEHAHDGPAPARPTSRNAAQVLDILTAAPGPLTAYEVMDRMRPERRTVAPPTVYRALASLVADGRVHRVESLNAYVECRCSDHGQAVVFAICDGCGSVSEHGDEGLLSRLASDLEPGGFAARRALVEVRGTCAECRAPR